MHHLRCDLRLTLGSHQVDLSQVDVSASGIARLPLPESRPSPLGELTPGQKGEARVVLAGPAGTPGNPTVVTVHGRVTRERTLSESCHGFAFDWHDHEATRLVLSKALTDWGYALEPNRRKHERIRALPSNPVVPTTAHLNLSRGSAFENVQPGDPTLWTARIHNLSPGGLLLSTESAEAARIKPGDGLDIIIPPRDPQGFTIEVLGGVRRVLEHVERINGSDQLVWSLGVRFEWLDEDQRSLYLSLLKCIG
jgi:hypothetical protein